MSKVITLQSAILIQMKEFAKIDKPFNVHDITRAIREKTASGEWDIPDVVVTGTPVKYNISHDKVRTIFNEMWDAQLFLCPRPLSRKFNGMYNEYFIHRNFCCDMEKDPAIRPEPTDSTGQLHAEYVSYTHTGDKVAVKSNENIIPHFSVLSDSSRCKQEDPVAKRIDTYISNCYKRKTYPTVKQIQSAIKRRCGSGWTCKRIYDYLKKMGYSVQLYPKKLSKSYISFMSTTPRLKP